MDDLNKLKQLAGITNGNGTQIVPIDNAQRHAFIREHNIKPGTPRWMKVMYAKPHLTGEDPFGE
jgi:hypothetical protein